MKYITLKKQNNIDIQNKYEHNIKVIKENNEYYIIDDNNKLGPFRKIAIDCFKAYNNDIFLFGITPLGSKIYRIGVWGLETTGSIDPTQEDSPSAILKKEQDIIKEYTADGNTFLCKTKSYNISNKALGTGEVTKRKNRFLIFKDRNNSIFTIDSSLPKIDSKRCKRYDSIPELILSARANNIDFDDITYLTKHNWELTRLFYSLVKQYPDSTVSKILNQVKEILGKEEFQNTQYPFSHQETLHSLISLPELRSNIEQSPIKPETIQKIKDRNLLTCPYASKMLFFRDHLSNSLPTIYEVREFMLNYNNETIIYSPSSSAKNPKELLSKAANGEYYNYTTDRKLLSYIKTSKPEILYSLNKRFLSLRHNPEFISCDETGSGE